MVNGIKQLGEGLKSAGKGAAATGAAGASIGGGVLSGASKLLGGVAAFSGGALKSIGDTAQKHPKLSFAVATYAVWRGIKRHRQNKEAVQPAEGQSQPIPSTTAPQSPVGYEYGLPGVAQNPYAPGLLGQPGSPDPMAGEEAMTAQERAMLEEMLRGMGNPAPASGGAATSSQDGYMPPAYAGSEAQHYRNVQQAQQGQPQPQSWVERTEAQQLVNEQSAGKQR